MFFNSFDDDYSQITYTMTDANTDRQLKDEEHRARMQRALGNRVGLRGYVTSMRGNTANCRQHFVDSVKRGSQFGAFAGLLMGTTIGVRSKNVPGNTVARVVRACAVSIPVGALMFTGAGLTAGIGYCLFFPMQNHRQ